LNFFINPPTLARLIASLLATTVNDIPERRSSTTCSRLMASRALPTFERGPRIPARTLSPIRDLSSSAIALTMTRIARPSGPSVDGLVLAEELDAESVQFVEHLQQVPG
jgi:hypothetical protein